jgi:hypothetical protein
MMMAKRVKIKGKFKKHKVGKVKQKQYFIERFLDLEQKGQKRLAVNWPSVFETKTKSSKIINDDICMPFNTLFILWVKNSGSLFYPSSSTKDAFCVQGSFLWITYCFKVWHKGRTEVHFRVAEPTNPSVKELKVEK